MGITVSGKSPIIMDAIGDNLASVFQGRDMQSTTGVPRLCLVGVEFVQGADGKTILLDQNGGGTIFESPELSAGENYYLKCDRWVSNLYVQSIPANSKVLLHYA